MFWCFGEYSPKHEENPLIFCWPKRKENPLCYSNHKENTSNFLNQNIKKIPGLFFEQKT